MAPEWRFTAAGLFFLLWVVLLATLFFFFPSHGPLLSSFLHSLSSQAFLWYLYFPPELSSTHTDLEFSSATRPAPSVLASHWLTSSHVTQTGGGTDSWLSSQVLELYGLISHVFGCCWTDGQLCDCFRYFFFSGRDGRFILCDHVQEAAEHREQRMPGQHDPRDTGYLPEDGPPQTTLRVQARQDHCPPAAA